LHCVLRTAIPTRDLLATDESRLVPDQSFEDLGLAILRLILEDGNGSIETRINALPTFGLSPGEDFISTFQKGIFGGVKGGNTSPSRSALEVLNNLDPKIVVKAGVLMTRVSLATKFRTSNGLLNTRI
jgi:hypothetical protein